MNKKIAIIGGGPGGLTLARLLQLKGITVNVYERDINSSARVQGAIVDLHYESGLKVIEKAGLMDAFKAHYMKGANQYRIVDKHATIHFGKQQQSDFGDEQFRPEIDRGALRKILSESLLPGTIIWDSEFVSMQQVNNVWEILFKNGSTATADIVVGADGARSKVRPYVTDIKAKYSGATIIRGEIDDPRNECPAANELVANANMIALSDGKGIYAQPRGDGGLTFYATAQFPENWVKTSGIDFNNSEAVSGFLAEFYEGWHSTFHDLFKACKKFTPQPLNYFPLDQYWEAHTNVTIIGDAAHLMPPSGEGVNTAMLDALDLSEHLDIAVYEKHMRERAAVLAEESLKGTAEMYLDSALADTVQMFKQMW
jgi:2-polyprenyl-6-methoxyphenol hydroxylase-like FAD-dependent oxidoreductase